MKKIIFILMLICSVHLAEAQHTAAEHISKTLTAQTVSWNSGNLEAFMEPYWKSDSLLFIGKNGLTYGWQSTLNNYKKSYPTKAAMGILAFDILEIKQLNKKHVLVVGKWMLTRTMGNLSGHFSLLWKKMQGTWVIVMDHSS